jgi:hypothetical protein
MEDFLFFGFACRTDLQKNFCHRSGMDQKKNSSAFPLGQSSNCNAILRNLQKTKGILGKEAEQID